MIRYTLLLLAGSLLAPALASADEKSKSKADAEAALAVAKARASAPAIAAKTRLISYADAAKLAKKTGQPIFVNVGLECKSTCASLRPDFLTCHEKEFEGSAKPRAALVLPAKDGALFRVQEWPTMPAAADVKASLETWRKKVSADSEAAPDAAVIAALALGLIAVQPVEAIADQNCPGGICPVPVSTSFSRTSDVVTTTTASGRFPRVAAFRARLRGAFGRVFPRLAGGFYSFAPAVESAPAPVTAAGAEAVVKGKLTAEHLRKLRAAGIDLRTIIALLVKWGPVVIDMLIEFLDALKTTPEKVGCLPTMDSFSRFTSARSGWQFL